MTQRNRISVLYIGGEGRSGSTLLSAILGQYRDFFPVGELRSIWHAVQTNELCGCGKQFNACDFWLTVGDEAFGGWNHVDVGKMLALDTHYARHRFVGRLLLPPLRRRHASGLEDYATVLRSLYTAVRDVSKRSIIVDSTKDPTYAFLLHAVTEVDLRVVHLVRDSRGVAYSWEKARVARPEYANHPTLSQTFMDRKPPWKAGLEWDMKNALIHLLERSHVPRMLMRYESLVEHPDVEIQRVLAFVDRGSQAFADVESRSVAQGEYESRPNHTIGGNRIRFLRGVVRVRVDEEWRNEMRATHWFTVTALTLPLLATYGYVGSVRAGATGGVKES